jgi:hypothetical protein
MKGEIAKRVPQVFFVASGVEGINVTFSVAFCELAG